MIDLGKDVTAELLYLDGELDGVRYTHICNGRQSSSQIPVKPAWRTGWDVVSVEPLTLSPSILCTGCKHHGYITNGRWVPC